MEKKQKDKKSKKSKLGPVPTTMKIATESNIASDFAKKLYEKFDKMVKSVVLFGSSAKKLSKPSSDIDIIIIIDDVSIKWDQELISWYRAELGEIMKANPYRKEIHINTVKLSTWWQDLLRGDPVVINIIRYGEPIIDFGGFFIPLKVLLQEGKIKPTPESIYTLLQRTPQHILRSRAALVSVIDGLYWAMVDSAHATLIAANKMPSSPENIGEALRETFVVPKLLNKNYVEDYIGLHNLEKEIVHGKNPEVKGADIDNWFEKTNEFVRIMAKLIDEILEKK